MTPTPTETPTVTPTNFVFNIYDDSRNYITPTVTPTVTLTPTVTPTNTVTPTITVSPSVTPTRTPTVTPTITLSNTVTPTVTPTITLSNTLTPTVTPTVTLTPTVTPTKTRPPNLSITLSGIGLAEGDQYYVPNNNIYSYGVKYKGSTNILLPPTADRLFFNPVTVGTDYAFVVIKDVSLNTIGVFATTKNFANNYFAWSSAGMSRKYYFRMASSPPYITNIVFPRDNLWP